MTQQAVSTRTVKENQFGQSFVELIIIVAVVILLVTGLIVGTVSSLKTTNFASSKSQATKYAQEGIELARRERDTGWYAFYANRSNKTFCVNKTGAYIQGNMCAGSNLIDATFSRIVSYIWNSAQNRMEVTVTVSWPDGGGTHKSQVSTYFTQWR